MKCDICNRNVYSIITIYKDGNKIIGCRKCISGDLTPVINFRNIDDTMGFKIGTGHLKDIRSRKIDHRTGEVYRDTGKKFI